MSVTCNFNGRLGNIIINMCQVIAHCKRYDLHWHFPTYAWACTNGISPITIPATGELPIGPQIYNEPHDTEDHPYYHEVPVRDNVAFHGYYQSFRYFDDYRNDILELFNLPYQLDEHITSLHCRRGDCVNQPDAFPMAPMEYYHAAVDHMMERGHFQFKVFSDDIPWCIQEFTEQNYPGAVFVFIEGGSDIEDFIVMSQCENNILARSTFSLMASWFNQNPNKICVCPSMEQRQWWHKCNRNLLDTNYLTQLTW